MWIHVSQHEFYSLWRKISYVLSLSTIKQALFFIFAKGKDVIYQYPSCFNVIMNFFIRNSIPKNRSYLLIHDINSLRKENFVGLSEEIKVLNSAKVIISHNEQMTDILRQNGLKTKVVNLEIFDYLLSNKAPVNNEGLTRSVIFAGNIEKSLFLKNEKLDDLGLTFYLFGPNYEASCFLNTMSINYIGCYPPEELAYKLKGSFGLIWDGDSLDSCSGPNGKYMMYNNPHKLSLYIAAQKPVIVWKYSAAANIVKKYDIGLIVNNLYEIETQISQLTDDRYKELKENVSLLQRKITTGFFSNRAFAKCEEILCKNNL